MGRGVDEELNSPKGGQGGVLVAEGPAGRVTGKHFSERQVLWARWWPPKVLRDWKRGGERKGNVRAKKSLYC